MQLFGQNLSRNTQPVLILPHAAAGGTVLTSTVLDLEALGADSVAVVGRLSVRDEANAVRLEVSPDGVDGWVELRRPDGVAVAVVPSADGNVFFFDLIQPPEVFVRLVVDRRGADAEVGDVYAFPYGLGSLDVGDGVDELGDDVPEVVDYLFAYAPSKVD